MDTSALYFLITLLAEFLSLYVFSGFHNSSSQLLKTSLLLLLLLFSRRWHYGSSLWFLSFPHTQVWSSENIPWLLKFAWCCTHEHPQGSCCRIRGVVSLALGFLMLYLGEMWRGFLRWGFSSGSWAGFLLKLWSQMDHVPLVLFDILPAFFLISTLPPFHEVLTSRLWVLLNRNLVI